MLENAKITVPDTVLAQIMPDGEAALVNLDTEQYFGLDSVGADMWTALTETGSVTGAFERLLEEYDVNEDQLREDLKGLVDSLESRGLIEVNGA